MFADDNSIESLKQLFVEFKKYLILQKEYTKLELIEKISILFSTLTMLILFVILGMIALFYLLFAFAYVLETWVGSLQMSFAIIGVFNILLILLVYLFRKKLIINPMVRFIATLFISDSK